MITALLLSCLPSTALVQAEDAPVPKVVFTRPAQDQVVPAGPAAIVVEFDVAMDARSFSWGPSTDTMPEPAEEPRWMNDNIWSFNLDLEPNTTYSFVLNPEPEQGFVSLKGVPLETTEVRFSTNDLRSDTAPIARHQAAADALIAAMQARYAYRDQRSVDWAQWERETQAKLYPVRNSKDFAALATEQLALLEDLSIQVQLKGKSTPSFRPRVDPNYDRRRTLGLLSEIQSLSAYVIQAQATPQMGYLAIDFWTQSDALPAAELFTEALKTLETDKGLIIDVRANRGGEAEIALNLAARLLNDPAVYAKTASPDAEGVLGEAADLRLEPVRPRFSKPVAVLQGPTNMGVNEVFVLAASQSERVRTFGAATYGAAGQTQAIDLGNDVQILLPTERTTDAKGGIYEGQGIAPDQSVPWSEEGDPVLAAAIAWLNTQ